MGLREALAEFARRIQQVPLFRRTLPREATPRRTIPAARAVPFVEALDRAITEVRRLEAGWTAAGDEPGVELAQRMGRYLEKRRLSALEGRIPANDGTFHLGISRFASEYNWGPHGEAFVDAAYEADRVWAELDPGPG